MGALADDIASNTPPPTKQVLGKIADLLQRSGIPVDEVARVQRVNVWQGFHKNADGEAEVVDLAGIQLVPGWADGPQWPVVATARPCVIKPAAPGKPRTGGLRRAVILPDVQIGYRDLREGLDPFHDEAAMACALAICKAVDPDLVVLLGDTLDLPHHSRFVQEPSWARTTQAAIDRCHRFLTEITAASPHATRRAWLEGNHDLRLAKNVQVNAAASFGLQRANMPDSWPVLTPPFLCRADEAGWDYVSGYPAAEIWVNDRLRCIHGLKVRSGGSTAKAVIDDERVSTIFGHIHRIELQHKTRQVRSGPRFNLAASPGCLCRVDGAVPSVKGGIDLLGRPLTSYEDWQNGMAVVTYEEGDAPFALELIPIHSGSAIYRGERFGA